ncbi:hypothetical protein E3Z71_07820 [Listeria monocytogenes]|uniref:Uncharacterized protein n=1 Tax=Listeria monocytogenes TaxID=1639 RepID=A0A463XIR6_LISMN|nr:hypothetical protein [Listeria monocytogenes]MDA18886.1 hypothetical protein [Listeria monocytogenes serotype 4a]EAC4812264.1 hypothetical protein [Listeria monocytogenes]EAC7281012.1 hypothetical protein [Listeria monocytogenes]EAC7287054.1 hypothetical protein [Listeria monocytogenes]
MFCYVIYGRCQGNLPFSLYCFRYRFRSLSSMFILLNFLVNVQLDVIYERKLTVSNMLEKTLKIVFDRKRFPYYNSSCGSAPG